MRSSSRVRLNIPLMITSDVTVNILWFEKCKIGQACTMPDTFAICQFGLLLVYFSLKVIATTD